MFAGHLGIETVCECRVKTNPRLFGGGGGGAGSPTIPGCPLKPSVEKIDDY